MRRHPPRLEVHLGGAPVIAVQERPQQLREMAALADAEAPHDAEIDGGNRSVLLHEKVTGVEIGVEEAVPEDLHEKGGHRFFQDRFGVVPDGGEGVPVIDADAVDPRRGQDAPSGALPIHLGHVKFRVVFEIFAELGGGGGLEAQVHLHFHRIGQGPHHLDGFQAAPFRARRLDQLGAPQEQVEVAGEGFLDAGAQHFDRHVAAVVGHREMDLGNGGGGDGHVVELREHFIERRAELVFDGGAGQGAAEGRQAVLQFREVGGHLLAEKVGTGRQALSQLDEARPRLIEGGGQPLAGPALDAAPR